MKLVEFEISRNRSIYINPEHIVQVMKHTDSKSMIYLLGPNIHVVLHSVEEVVAKLTQDEDSRF